MQLLVIFGILVTVGGVVFGKNGIEQLVLDTLPESKVQPAGDADTATADAP